MEKLATKYRARLEDCPRVMCFVLLPYSRTCWRTLADGTAGLSYPLLVQQLGAKGLCGSPIKQGMVSDSRGESGTRLVIAPFQPQNNDALGYDVPQSWHERGVALTFNVVSQLFSLVSSHIHLQTLHIFNLQPQNNSQPSQWPLCLVSHD